MKAAVIYYSKSGKTKKIAEKIAQEKGADLFFIEPENPYGTYISSVIRAGKELKSKKAVGTKTKIFDFSKYEVIFIGFPIWHGTLPFFFQEYIKKCAIDGKRIIPFATATASGKESALLTLQNILPNSKITEYFYTSAIKKADVDKWLSELKL
ncbi:flavodoxin [Treponema pectinovorum]|uniref:flavodoxin n=1 Tax=Treponema pectinovorum TaxID=164 RepID=UPI0011CB6E0C|nr:flavodoxin [Treponema pectinovorum]